MKLIFRGYPYLYMWLLKFNLKLIRLQNREQHPISKIVAWFAMLNLQEPWFDRLTASAQPWPIVFSSMLFNFGLCYQRNHLQCYCWSLAITCYDMASAREPCEGSCHLIKNGCMDVCHSSIAQRMMVKATFQVRPPLFCHLLHCSGT